MVKASVGGPVRPSPYTRCNTQDPVLRRGDAQKKSEPVVDRPLA